MSNPDAARNIHEVTAVRTRKETEKDWHIVRRSFMIKRKRLLLRLQRKPENIKNLMENTFNVRAVNEQLKQYDDLLKLFLGV